MRAARLPEACLRHHSLYGLGLAFAAALLISPDTLLMRLSHLGGVEMMTWRGLLACAVMLTLWPILSRSRRADLRALTGRAGIVATACQTANAVLFVTGIAVAPVAVVLFSLATVPIWAAIFGALFLGDRVGRATMATCVVVLAGIGLSVFAGEHGSTEGDPVLGAICGLLVAFALAGAFTSYRAAPAIPIMLSVGIGGGIAGVIGFLLSDTLVPEESWRVLAIAATGVVILPACFFMFGVASRHTSGANVSLFMLLETVLGPLFVWIALGEAVPPLGLAGGAIVVVALALYLDHQRRTLRGSSAGSRRPRAPEPPR